MFFKNGCLMCMCPGRCVLCKMDNEGSGRSFIFALSNGCRGGVSFGVMPLHCKDIFQVVTRLWGSGKRRKKLWITAVIALCWSIWLERIIEIFDSVEGSVEAIWERIRFWVALSVFKAIEFKDVLFLDSVIS